MRRISLLAIIAIAILSMLVACNRSRVAETQVKYEDTVGFADFQAWKAQNERAALEAQNNVATTNNTTTRSTSTRTRSGSVGSQTSYPAQTTTKKGWSKAAKGAVIGAASGAVLGAVINKRNRVAGGVIGGVIGGGVGYGIGRSQDKKDGRY